MRDFLRVVIEVRDRDFRTATGMTQWDDDIVAEFLGVIDDHRDRIHTKVKELILEILQEQHPDISWKITVDDRVAPMSLRGKRERTGEE